MLNTVLWTLAVLLGAAYLAGGLSLALMSKDRYRALGASQHWVDDFGDRHLTAIGSIKVVGAVGLVLPAALDIAPILVPLAACGLMLVMAGAGTTRFRRSEWGYLIGDLVYLGLFAFLAWGRFALEPFG